MVVTTRSDFSPSYPQSSQLLPGQDIPQGHYELGFTRSLAELDEVLRLRFEVFNLELGEGLETSRETGRDLDEFDAQCHHLKVRDLRANRIVGTYRMQTYEMATAARGFYSADEFDLSALPERIVRESVEVGRACVAADYRNNAVLFLLWRGLATYMRHAGKRYLFGCSSLTSQDPAEGTSLLRQLEAAGHMHPHFVVPPTADYVCPVVEDTLLPVEPVKVPKLFRTYLRIGAKVCGPPAIDRRFKTIDFLILFDLDAMDEKTFRTFFL
ncbi:MAG: GNAT family N-acetyltransferase [Acidobacteria bacterium]|nr:GNAT family N-acetyltransferase [Acidobacteriota bacterium]